MRQIRTTSHTHILFISCLLMLLAACSSPAPTGSAPTQSATPAPSPTKAVIAPGTVLYQANWSAGLTDWRGDATGWKIDQGQLVSSGGTNLTITAPYQSTVSNYAIEVRLQIEKLTGQGGRFLIFASKIPDKDGYRAGVIGLGEGPRQHGGHPSVEVLIDPIGSMEPGSANISDYEPGTKWHDCRIEVRDNQVEFFIDGASVSNATSSKTTTLSGTIGIISSSIVLRVDGFRVVAL